MKTELLEVHEELDKELQKHDLLRDHTEKIENENKLLNQELIDMKNNETFEKSNNDKKLYEAYKREQLLHSTIESNTIKVEKIIEEKEKIQRVTIILFIYIYLYFIYYN